jgi:hypothetical protein
MRIRRVKVEGELIVKLQQSGFVQSDLFLNYQEKMTTMKKKMLSSTVDLLS